MSEPKLISPLLDNFVMGAPISEHHGVRCCPAMENESNDKYIVKVISVPATQSQMEAMLLSGAYADKESALVYFKELADSIASEAKILNELSTIDGFVPYRDFQLVPMEDGNGYDVYLLGQYKRSLTKHFTRHIMTHLDVLNLGLDLCASLSVCRKSGYLYVDLKPENIFVTGDHTYRIGDLGFVRLNSLKYSSLPDRYLSAYTAPEVTDAFSTLNTTIDIYAAGLVLYQAYNNGELPKQNSGENEPFSAPMYADYEMSEIILKACAPNPEDRWQDPMQMGQAIISYMQRNGASDLPIGPVPVEDDSDETTDTESSQEEAAIVSSEEDVSSRDESVAETVENSPVVEDSDDVSADDTEEPVYAEDSLGNFFFLENPSIDETDPEYHSALIDYAEISDEVSEMLTQADELVAMEIPEPVVVPDYVEISIPEMMDILQEEAAAEVIPADSEQSPQEVEDIVESAPPRRRSTTRHTTKKKSNWVRNSILILILLALISCGIYYYQHYYLIPINSIVLDGNEDSLTVLVDTNIDESTLLVICSDTYGNQIPAPVVNGQASFTGLIPDTAYNIQVVTNGFHRLIGKTSTAYSTPVQTSIVQYNAATGSTDGSVILSFTIDGPSCDEWMVHYSAEGEAEQTVTFPAHTVTLTGLTIGKEYTFRIEPKESLYISGTDTLNFTASKVITAQNLAVVSFMDEKLSVSWAAKDDAEVEMWTVRCYNDSYSETVITPNTEAIFEGIDHSQTYLIEVIAQGMSIGQHTSVEKDTVNAYNITAYTPSSAEVFLSWEASYAVPDTGWVFRYWLDGDDNTLTELCYENEVRLSPVIPGATYHYLLEDAEGRELLGSAGTFSVPDALPFSCNYQNYIVTSNNLAFYMCKTPDVSNWDRFNLSSSDYTTSFQVGEKASFLVYLNRAYGTSDEKITTLFVITDDSGKLINYSHCTDTWTSMWYRNYCELDVPTMPAEPGEYTMHIYFNGALAATQTFSVIS
ncbi:MAG: protein kinase [Oscillospiraceae bacterium]|nr:protein kinase [Oscillospiraceae bacterium]